MNKHKVGDKIYFTGSEKDLQPPGWFEIIRADEFTNFLGITTTTYAMKGIGARRTSIISSVREIYEEYTPGIRFIIEAAYKKAYDEKHKEKPKTKEDTRMELKEITTLREVSRETGIPESTLRQRLKAKSRGMEEGIDYRNLGPRMPVLLSPQGAEKLKK